MSVKTYERFLAENLAGEYCYYGPGSLVPLVRKLYDEGKSLSVVSMYLRSLGIDEMRRQYVIGCVFGQDCEIEESSVFEDDVDDLISTDTEDDLAGSKKDKDEKKDKDKDDEDDDEEEDDDEDGDEEKSDATEPLQQILDDQKKMDKIKSILKEHKTSDMPSDLTVENIVAYENKLRLSLNQKPSETNQ
mgnify:CR=1 FL=1